ncbi:WD40 repeat domain-containing protein [Bartonella vinsonii]|uniref:WD-repeat family protein n=1 Tax=Bartonella vinsonii subsp. berkhoffii str. Tweed TaxID=1094502 RepID=N6VTY5_BARVB|nr:WD40 repeat domain-containing protein [Bartonella vinsonii]AGF76275.1 WD-repeat family protein [Bartonella vinsonii subsp. berkhoffii str. Winnie]ENN94512.1 WD-repeat family protein [Bartonella vinsonii subsp. berkhoffii str. Tweed]
MPNITPYNLQSYCLSCGFIDNKPVFVSVEGLIVFLNPTPQTIEVHQGIISSHFSYDNTAIITGGEDGKACQTTADGQTKVLGQQERKWINKVAFGPQKIFAFASSRLALANVGKGLQELKHERSVEGLAFAPKGLRLAVAHYNGVTLHWLSTQIPPTTLVWKGAHFDVTFSPDNRYVISTMQENALHGWRLTDQQHLRMSGYPSKVKSWSWSTKGKWLATSGASAAIIWPFHTKDGPMGKTPLELGTRAHALVSAVSCHPSEEIVAIGFHDGMILCAHFHDGKEILLKDCGKSAISALNWDQTGHNLAFGSENGECGIINMTV